MLIFCAQDGQNYYYRNGRVRSFKDKPKLPKGERLQLFGNRAGALFYETHLRAMREAGELELSIGSPQFVKPQPENGRWLVEAATKVDMLRPHQGGWRAFDRNDEAHFELAGAATPAHFGSAELRSQHPLARFFRFMELVNPLDPFAFSCVLAELVDPRWFVHLEKPERRTRVHAYLGLVPSVLKTASDSVRVKCQARSAMLVTAFMGRAGQEGRIAKQITAATSSYAQNNVLKRAVNLIFDFWIAELSTHPEMLAPDIFLSGFQDREAMLSLWHATAPGSPK